MTTHNFSLDRLCMLLRWNWTNSRRQTLRIGMILSAFLGVAYTFMLSLVQRQYIYANDISRLPDMVGTFVIAIVLRVLPLILCAMGALIFSNMETKPMREHYLMLPASHAEKYATRFIHITLGGVLTFAVALVAGDVIQFALSFIFHPGIHHSCLWDMICCFITGSGNQQVADMLLFRGNIAEMTIAYSGLVALLLHLVRHPLAPPPHSLRGIESDTAHLRHQSGRPARHPSDSPQHPADGRRDNCRGRSTNRAEHSQLRRVLPHLQAYADNLRQVYQSLINNI